MASVAPTALTKDTYTKVLTNVTFSGSVHILDLEVEPSVYLVAFVDTGDAKPADSFTGGIPFKDGFAPSDTVASDYYVMPKDNDGLVEILV